jgi:formate/nitrite transporter FocA (FNT family)
MCSSSGAYFFAYLPEMFTQDPWFTAIKSVAGTKTGLGFGVAFLRGIAANWLVNIAIFVVTSAEDVSGKILALLYPIAAFAAAGYGHCVAK